MDSKVSGNGIICTALNCPINHR